MGIFSFTAHKPGKGVSKDGPKLKRPFLMFAYLFENFWNFIKMSLLFTLTCIPVVTIGPSICGLTYFSKCVTTDVHMFLLSEYFETFKKNFFKGLFASVINLIPVFSLFLVYSNIKLIPHFQSLLIPLVIVNILVIMMSFYIYPLIISYDIPLWAVYKNSFIFAMIKFPLNFIIAVIAVALILVAFGFYPIIGFILTPLFLAAFVNYLPTFAVWPTIKKYMEE